MMMTHTAESYSRHWATFCAWCADNAVEPMPASPRMIMAYVGHLAERGTIAEASLQPYLSAINSMHADADLPRPALGHFVQRVRQGMARAQAARQTRDTRVPLPAPHVLRILHDTLHRAARLRASMSMRAFTEWLRRRAVLVLAFIFFGRQDSCVALQTCDLAVEEGFIWIRLTEKMKKGFVFRRVIRLPLDAPPVRGHASALASIADILRMYESARESLCTGLSCVGMGSEKTYRNYRSPIPG